MRSGSVSRFARKQGRRVGPLALLDHEPYRQESGGDEAQRPNCKDWDRPMDAAGVILTDSEGRHTRAVSPVNQEGHRDAHPCHNHHSPQQAQIQQLTLFHTGSC